MKDLSESVGKNAMTFSAKEVERCQLNDSVMEIWCDVGLPSFHGTHTQKPGHKILHTNIPCTAISNRAWHLLDERALMKSIAVNGVNSWTRTDDERSDMP